MGKRKTKSNKKKPWYLRCLVYFTSAFIGAFIAIFVTIAFTDLLLNIKYNIIPPTIELGINKIFIYKRDLQKIPACEIEIVCINNNSIQIPIEFKSITLFKENIQCQFQTGDFLIKPGPKDVIRGKHVFNDIILDEALKIPQDSSNTKIKLVYEYSNFNIIDTIFINDSDVIKCTYWQKPQLKDTIEFKSIPGLYLLGIGKSSLDPLKYKNGIENIDVLGVTNKAGLYDIDMGRFGEMLTKNSFYITLPINSFKRKYGGFYVGEIKSYEKLRERNTIVDLKAGDYFSKIDEYTKYELLGLSIEDEFSEVIEFIHLVIDPRLKNEKFLKYQDIMDVYIHIMSEEEEKNKAIEANLRSKGYRVGSKKIDFWSFWQMAIDNYSNAAMKNSMKDYINNNMENINAVIDTGAIFIFCLRTIEDNKLQNISKDVSLASGIEKQFYQQYNFDPIQAWLIPAPFSIPILAFVNYGDKASKIELDSVKVR